MPGYESVMKKIVNAENEDVLGTVCGAYMCTVDLGKKKDEPAVITVDGMKYGTKQLLGKEIKCVTYDVAVYSCREDLAAQGKHCWACIGSVPSAFGLLENELGLIKTRIDAVNIVKMSLAAGFESAVKMVIKTMDKMTDEDKQKFEDDIITREDMLAELEALDEDDELYDDEDEDGPGYDADGGCSNFDRQARAQEKYYEEDDYDDRLSMRS